MKQGIYRTVNLYKQSFFQKLFNQQPEENAIIELNNLLASKPIRDISLYEVNDISAKYRLNLISVFPRNIAEFYTAYLGACLEDMVITDEELDELNHLKMLLNLTDENINKINERIINKVYLKEYDEVIKDGIITEQERKFLDKLQNDLRLNDSIADKISAESRKKLIESKLQEIIEDGRISPTEETEFYAIAKSLNIDVKIDDANKVMFEKLKLYWTIENAELSPITVDISLQKNEECYFTTSVRWHELRTETTRYNYGGPTASIKIMKGVYYRVGSVNVQPIKRDILRQIDLGTLYLTNKRIIFVGSKKNSNIRLDKVLFFTPYSDGIEIGKDTGKSPFLSFTNNLDIFGILLSRLLRDK
jgi:hypothetical protein